jgi:uncharacterized protein DUF4435
LSASLAGQDLLAELVLVRASFKGTLLLLEGGHDCITLDRHVDLKQCKTIPSGGKQPLLEALVGAHARGMKGVLGVVDADYWHVDGGVPRNANLIVLPVHDLEILLLGTHALEDVLTTHGSDSKINRLLSNTRAASVRDLLLNRAALMGGIRRFSHLKKLGLRFDGVNMTRYVDRRSLHVDEGRLVQRILQNTANPKVSLNQVLVGSKRHQPALAAARQICNGHDIVEILSVGLRRSLGSCDAKTASVDNVSKLLRLSFDSRYLKACGLESAFRSWEGRNQGYRVLP